MPGSTFQSRYAQTIARATEISRLTLLGSSRRIHALMDAIRNGRASARDRSSKKNLLTGSHLSDQAVFVTCFVLRMASPNWSMPIEPAKNMNIRPNRSEEHTSELQSHSFISYAVFCLK